VLKRGPAVRGQQQASIQQEATRKTHISTAGHDWVQLPDMLDCVGTVKYNDEQQGLKASTSAGM
jgi:hypothetical protein